MRLHREARVWRHPPPPPLIPPFLLGAVIWTGIALAIAGAMLFMGCHDDAGVPWAHGHAGPDASPPGTCDVNVDWAVTFAWPDPACRGGVDAVDFRIIALAMGWTLDSSFTGVTGLDGYVDPVTCHVGLIVTQHGSEVYGFDMALAGGAITGTGDYYDYGRLCGTPFEIAGTTRP